LASGIERHSARFEIAAALAASLVGSLGIGCRAGQPARQPAPAVIVAESPAEPSAVEEPPTIAEDPVPSECRVEVRLTSIEKASSCWVDLPEEGARGVLQTRCGDGPATLRFDKHDYEGTITRGRFQVARETRFPFEDGCEWESSQSVSGSADGDLVITYSEHPVTEGECAAPCSATARVETLR